MAPITWSNGYYAFTLTAEGAKANLRMIDLRKSGLHFGAMIHADRSFYGPLGADDTVRTILESGPPEAQFYLRWLPESRSSRYGSR